MPKNDYRLEVNGEPLSQGLLIKRAVAREFRDPLKFAGTLRKSSGTDSNNQP